MTGRAGDSRHPQFLWITLWATRRLIHKASLRTRAALDRLPGAAVLPGPALAGCADGPQCVPYARQLTGMAFYGPAASWWRQGNPAMHAATPAPGAVLVLRATGLLPDGHVAVVRQVPGPSDILVAPANWEPGRIAGAWCGSGGARRA